MRHTAHPLTSTDTTALAAVFSALSHPVRLNLLAAVRSAPAGEVCVCDLVAGAGVAQSTVSHHLRILLDAGLPRREQRGNWAWYSPTEGRFEAAVNLLYGQPVAAR